MLKQITVIAVAFSSLPITGQVPSPRPKFEMFEVATIKQVESAAKSGRFIKMQGVNRFIEKDYTLKLLIAAAYDLSPRTIIGGPGWINSEHFDIQAVTPGDVRPTHDEQMSMLRSLLDERFKLRSHREPKEFSIYVLELAKGGPKLKSTAHAEEPPVMGPAVVYPQRIVLPARNAKVAELASILQRAILDRPVMDQTGLSGRYDFDLEWAPDETQFGGEVPTASATAPSPPLFQAVEQELGLRLRATKGPVAALVVDKAEQPTAN